jgi:hypothetical protein
MNKIKNSVAWWSNLDKINIVASLICAVIGAFIGIITYSYFFEDRILNRIVDKLKNQEIIQQIASLVRPSVIFDHNGTILHDSGGAKFIREIKVEITPRIGNKSEAVNKILIFPTEHLKEPLILECLNRNLDFACARISTIDWECEADSPPYVTMGSSKYKFIGKWKFRLEIIP